MAHFPSVYETTTAMIALRRVTPSGWQLTGPLMPRKTYSKRGIGATTLADSLRRTRHMKSSTVQPIGFARR